MSVDPRMALLSERRATRRRWHACIAVAALRSLSLCIATARSRRFFEIAATMRAAACNLTAALVAELSALRAR